MARKKITRISCGCKGKAISHISGQNNTTATGRQCKCNIDTPKGKSIQVTEANVDWLVFN